MALQDRIKKIYYANQLSTKFAEKVLFNPVDPDVEARNVYMSVTEQQDERNDDGVDDEVERYVAKMGRDENHATRGGVFELTFGDSFTRQVSIDGDGDRPLVFAGEILEKGLHYIRAVFVRDRRNSQRGGR